MAVEGDKDRSALKGHHLDGEMITHANGTQGFRQKVGQDRYHISDDDNASDPEYYGFTRSDGYWYILKITNSSSTYRYFAGSSAYATGWTNRAAHDYDYWDVIF